MADQAITEDAWNEVLREREAEAKGLPEETPPEPKVDELKQEQTPAEPSQEPVDPYAGLHPDVQAKLKQFDQLATSQAQLINELRATTGRVGALQSQWDKARANLEQPTQRQVAAAAKDPEKWSALKTEFPEWGEAINEFVEARLGSVAGGKGPSTEEFEQLVAQRTEAATASLRKELNEALVTVKHPSWRQTINTPEFGAWLPQQPPEVQALADSNDGFAAIRMLDLFETARAKPAEAVAAERKGRLAAAASTSKPAASGQVTKSLEDMTPEELWAYEAKQRAKRAA